MIFYSTKRFFGDYILMNDTLNGRQFDLKGLAETTYQTKNVTISRWGKGSRKNHLVSFEECHYSQGGRVKGQLKVKLNMKLLFFEGFPQSQPMVFGLTLKLSKLMLQTKQNMKLFHPREGRQVGKVKSVSGRSLQIYILHSCLFFSIQNLTYSQNFWSFFLYALLVAVVRFNYVI